MHAAYIGARTKSRNTWIIKNKPGTVCAGFAHRRTAALNRVAYGNKEKSTDEKSCN
jgi:hypothetical protein